MVATFRVAVLADIHGNVAALGAVLADLEVQAVDLCVVAGDLVMNGPWPAETLRVLHGLDAPTVCGNTDLEVPNGRRPIACWTRQQLKVADLRYLQTLPLRYRVTPPGGRSPRDDLLVVHASPRSCSDVLILVPHPLGTTFSQPTPESEAAVMLKDAEADLIVYGHIHYAAAGKVRGQQLASLGSVGFPFDGDPRAAYAIATWAGSGWCLAHRRVAYDHEAVAQAIETSGQPFPERYARMIRASNWFPAVQVGD